jgi:selenophosphate synthetase-related protein
MTKIEIAQKINTILSECATSTPVEDIRAMGTAMVKIADALEGRSAEEAKRIMQMAALSLEGEP